MTKLILLLILATSFTFGNDFANRLVKSAIFRTTQDITYDGSYHSIKYPNGDVPANIGVCTDVIIRSYRSLGFDLQKLVHKDMKSNFDKYPSKRIWRMKTTDKNIDHRRVPNLQVFFSRKGTVLKKSKIKNDYNPGDIVTWILPGNLPHIGIVSDKKTADGTPLIIHNIGLGPRLDDMLFHYKISGHYRYRPTVKT